MKIIVKAFLDVTAVAFSLLAVAAIVLTMLIGLGCLLRVLVHA